MRHNGIRSVTSCREVVGALVVSCEVGTGNFRRPTVSEAPVLASDRPTMREIAFRPSAVVEGQRSRGNLQLTSIRYAEYESFVACC